MSNQKRSIVLLSHAIGLDGDTPYPVSTNGENDLQALINSTKPKLLAIGGRYTVAPPLYSDGEMGLARLTNDGRLLVDAAISVGSVTVTDANVNGTDADNDPLLENPVPTGGKYEATLPIYNDGDVSNFHVDSRGRLIVSITDGDALMQDNGALCVSSCPITSDLNVTAFNMAGADQSFPAVDVTNYNSGSIQIVWDSATGTLDGVVYIEMSNDGSTWYEWFNTVIDSASGQDYFRGLEVDMVYVRARWDKNGIISGNLSISSVFKGV